MVARQMEILAALRSAADETVAFFATLAPEQLQVPVYSEEVRWTVAPSAGASDHHRENHALAVQKYPGRRSGLTG
jgi:hypothetical protein